MRILITGKNGQVGGEFSRLYHSPGDVVVVGRAECDLSSERSIRDLVRRVEPAVIINAGAYTAVDQAEAERELCFAVNAAAPRVLAEEAARLDALLIHYSTDYVFNGEKPEPYLESDPINPVSVYGASKAAGEAAIVRNREPLFGAPDQLGLLRARQELPAHHAPFGRRAVGIEGGG